jgi:hypothetical protein
MIFATFAKQNPKILFLLQAGDRFSIACAPRCKGKDEKTAFIYI